MLKFLITLHLLGATLLGRASNVQRAAKDERGSVSLEQVVITVALFIVAGLLVAAITAAVNSRIGQIN